MGAVRSDEVELDSNDDRKLRRRTAAATMTRSMGPPTSVRQSSVADHML